MLRLFRRTPKVEEKTRHAVHRTRSTWFRQVTRLFERSSIDDELWAELEELLIGADVGVTVAEMLLADLRRRVREEGLRAPEEARAALKEDMRAILDVGQQKGILWRDTDEPLPKPAVILTAGVNGTGKTTSIAKLANAFISDGKQVILAAGDTFRAAAIDQLRMWGERIGAPVIAHRQGADPGAVVFDALAAAEARQADLLIIDTAGRLHTKVNLMEELRKVYRVIQRKDPSAPHEVLLVVDATTGQNGLMQARYFTEAVGVTGLFLTKLDGTAKGGIIFPICHELGLPVRFVGTGEEVDDIAPFSADVFVEALFS